MLELNRQTQPGVQHRLITTLAHHETEVLEAQRLRFEVFAEEMGANLPSAKEGIDRRHFDNYCEHLLVRESSENKSWELIAYSHPIRRKNRRLLLTDRIRFDPAVASQRPDG